MPVNQKNEPQLTDIQCLMLKSMLEWQDYVYGYDMGFEDLLWEKKATKEELRENMKGLKEMGLVRMGHGGINDDGEVVGGTWFQIIYGKEREIEQLIKEKTI